ncbi:MAG TPA: PilN domain-containing protein [Fimbriimonadaceae bacterium]|nr:PilN domain-containing protein [Fimbriimonadaceae bacterium]
MSSSKGLALPAVLWMPGIKPETYMSTGYRDVTLAISRRATFLKAIRVPNATRSDVASALAVQMPHHFPSAAGELAFDFRMSEDVGPEGRLAVVAAVRTAQLREAIDDAHAGGLNPVRIVPVAFGSVELARSLGRRDAVVVEETDEGLGIDVVQGGELRYSRLAPRPRSEAEIDAEINRTLSIAGLPISETIASGGLQLESAAAETNSRPSDFLSHPDQIGINLELPEFRVLREKARHRTRVRIFSLLTACALILATVAYLDAAAASERARSVETRWKGRITREQRLLAAAKRDESQERAISETLQRAFRPTQRLQDISTLIANAAPSNVWLSGIAIERGRRVTLRGTALNGEAVSAFQQALSANERFRDVKLELSSSVLIEQTPVVQFAMSLHAVGNLPLIDRDSRQMVRR